jgi:TRAP transporter TAXI family solute receptor
MRRLTILFLAVVFMIAVLGATPGLAADKVSIRWGSTSTKSGFYAYFVALAKTVMKHYPEIDITVVETGAGLDNLKRLNEGTVDLGGTNTAVAFAQYAGVADYKDKPKFSKLRSLWGGFVLPINIFVRTDSKVKTIDQLNGKPFSHIPGSSADRLVMFLFKANGIKPKLLPLGAAGALDAVRMKRSVGTERLGIGEAAILSLQATVDLTFLPVTKDMVAKTEAVYPGQVQSMVLPAKSYPGQDEGVPSLAYSLAEYTTSDLPAEVAYKVAKAVHLDSEQLAGLSKSLAKGQFASAPWKLIYQDVPLHLGAYKYFKEIGVKVPDKLVPPEAK